MIGWAKIDFISQVFRVPDPEETDPAWKLSDPDPDLQFLVPDLRIQNILHKKGNLLKIKCAEFLLDTEHI
jgi:hypothetical protein